MLTRKNQSLKTMIFFLVIASLLCGHISAMEKAFDRDQNERIQKPLSTAQFKQLFVPLASGSDAFPVVLDQPDNMLIVNYQLDGNNVAQSIRLNDMVRFESKDPKKYNFLLQSPLKTGALTVSTSGSFAFQKPVKTQSASFTCKSVKFLDRFSSKKSLTLDVNCCNNSGDVTCVDIIFKGNRFNAMSGSTLNIHGAAALFPTQTFFNDGIISCAHNTLINTPLFENWGTLQTGNLHFDGGNILNEGSININDSFLINCEKFDHHGKMDIHNDCIFQKVGKLFTSRSSFWKVGGDWKAHIGDLTLEGNSSVGNSALLTVDSHAILSGPFCTPIFCVESDDLITCNYTAQLLVAHYAGLKAKDWIQFEGDVFKTLKLGAQSKSSPKLDAMLKLFPRGVFVHSERSGIKKAGTILSKNGTVQLDAKKGLTHTGLTDAGFGANALLLMNAESLSLEKDSILKALNARLTAKTSIDQFGMAHIKQQLVMEAPEIVFGGITQAENLFATGDNILATLLSRIDTENALLTAQQKITNAGTFKVSEQLVVKGQDIDLKETSDISTKNGNFTAVETLNNQGNLSASEALTARAKFVENSGTMAGKNIQVNADRLWWNQAAGVVIAEEGLTINALASTNTGGWMQANNLTINAAIDLNLLGVYRAKNTNINALIALNAGICIPKIDSLDDLLTQENGWKAAEGLLNTFAPTAGVVYMVGNNIIGIYQKGKDHEDGFCHKGNKLWENAKNLYENKDAGASDWIVLVCEAKNLAASAYQTVNSVTQAAGSVAQGLQQGCQMVHSKIQELNAPETKTDTKKTAETDTNTPETVKADTKTPAETNNAQKPAETNPNTPEKAKTDTETPPEPQINWKGVALQATSSLASTFGPQMNRDALIDMNFGIEANVNGHSRSLYNGNSGLSAFANTNTTETYSGNNSGVSVAGQNNTHAFGTYTNTGTAAGINIAITADNMHNDGTEKAFNKLTLEIKKDLKLGSKSSMSGSVVAIDTPSFEGDEGNTIASIDHTSIKTAHMDNQGSNSGVLKVEFTGDASQLNSIGQVDHLQYQGTLEGNLADTLAQGKSNLLNVTKSGSVTIDAGKQNVHLKDEHNMDHGLKVKTKSAMKCDKNLKSSKSVSLKTEDNLVHKGIDAQGKVSVAGKNITAKSTTNRTSDNKNYEDHIEQVIVTGNSIKAHATEQLVYEGVKTHSGKGGTTMTAAGKNVSAAVVCEKHTEKHRVNKKTGETETTKDTFRKAHVCEHTSEGGVRIVSTKDTIELEGTIIDSKGAKPLLDGKNGVNGYAAYDSHEYESHYKKDGNWFKNPTKKDLVSSSKTAKPVNFRSKQTPEVTSDVKIAMPLTGNAPNAIFSAPIIEKQLAMNEKKSSGTCEEPGYIWVDGGKPIKEDITYAPSFKGTIETNAQAIHSEEVNGRKPTSFKTTNKDAKITRERFNEIHIDQPNSYSHPTRAATIALAMAVTMTTSGIGMGVGGSVATMVGCKSAISTAMVTNATAAAVTSLSVQAADALLRSKGDVMQAARILANNQTLKNIALSAATAGTMAGAGEALNQILPAVKDAHNLAERLAYAAPRQAVNAGIKTAANVIAGQEFNDAALQNLKSAAADTVGIALTSEIGDAYAQGKIDPITHKALHTGAGALQGAIRGGADGALAGGMGAFVSETVADLIAPKIPSLEGIKTLEDQIGRPLTQEEFGQAWNDQLATYWQSASSTGDISKLAAFSVALLTHQDVDIAQITASNAIDNNFLVVPMAYCLMGAGIAYSVYEIHNAYQNGGPESALKQLGIEVATHGAGIIASKVVFKVAGIAYPTAKAAVNAALEAAPGLKLALGELAETLAVAGEKFGQSKIGKGIAKIKGNPDRVMTTPEGFKIPVTDVAEDANTLFSTMGKSGNNHTKKPSFKDIQSEVKSAKPSGDFSQKSKKMPSVVKEKAYTRPVVTRMTAKQAKIEAEKLGFQKTNYYSDKQPVFKEGKRYITPDKDGHNGGIWKMADSVDNLADRTTRLGTYDANLNRIGD